MKTQRSFVWEGPPEQTFPVMMSKSGCYLLEWERVEKASTDTCFKAMY